MVILGTSLVPIGGSIAGCSGVKGRDIVSCFESTREISSALIPSSPFFVGWIAEVRKSGWSCNKF